MHELMVGRDNMSIKVLMIDYGTAHDKFHGKVPHFFVKNIVLGV